LTVTGVNGETFTVAGNGADGNLSTRHVQYAELLASVSGLSLGSSSNGGLSSNYNALSTANSAITITPKSVTLTAPVVSKTYDGNTSLSTLGLANYVSGESLDYSNVTLSLKDAGTRYVTGATLADKTVGGVTFKASNYKLPSLGAESADNQVTVDRRALTVSASRIYDGSTDVTAGTTLGNRVSGETLTVSSATANSSHAADSTSNYISSLTLANGTGLVSNYKLQSQNLSAGVALSTGLSRAASVNTVNIDKRMLAITLANTNCLYRHI
jgi:hypothetical protein